MFRGIGSTPSPHTNYEQQVSQRFDVLAPTLLKAGQAERENTLKDVAAKNPALANRLRQFLDRTTGQPQSLLQPGASQPTADQGKTAGWPQKGWNLWKEELRDVQAIQAKIPTLADLRPAVGLTGQPRQSILFAPEEVPVMGTEPTADGQVTAFGQMVDALSAYHQAAH